MLETLEKSRIASIFKLKTPEKRTGPVWRRISESSRFGKNAQIAEIRAKAGLFKIIRPIIISVIAHSDTYTYGSNGEAVDVSLIAEGVLLAQTRLTFDDRGIADLDVFIGRDHLKMDLNIFLGQHPNSEFEG